MYESGDLKKGLKIEIDGEPHVIVQFEFTKPGKGQALYKCKLKNMITGSQFERTYRSDEKFKEANLEEHEMEYLYFDGESYCFMNNSNYEQEFMMPDQVGDAKFFLKENTTCKVLFLTGGQLLSRFRILLNYRSCNQIRGPREIRLPEVQNRPKWKRVL